MGILNLVIGQRNRVADAAEKKENKAAEQAYKYSKEVQVLSLFVVLQSPGKPVWRLLVLMRKMCACRTY